jgi:hypothetical protein
VIPASLGGSAVGGLDDRADLVALEVFHDTCAGSFEGHGEEALAGFEVLGVLRGDEAGEGVDGCEAGVARHGAVAAGGLEVIEERDHAAWIEVADVEVDYVRVCVLRGTGGAARRRRGIRGRCAGRDRAQAAMLREETAQGTGERVGLVGVSSVTSLIQRGCEEVRSAARTFAHFRRNGVEDGEVVLSGEDRDVAHRSRALEPRLDIAPVRYQRSTGVDPNVKRRSWTRGRCPEACGRRRSGKCRINTRNPLPE